MQCGNLLMLSGFLNIGEITSSTHQQNCSEIYSKLVFVIQNYNTWKARRMKEMEILWELSGQILSFPFHGTNRKICIHKKGLYCCWWGDLSLPRTLEWISPQVKESRIFGTADPVPASGGILSFAFFTKKTALSLCLLSLLGHSTWI